MLQEILLKISLHVPSPNFSLYLPYSLTMDNCKSDMIISNFTLIGMKKAIFATFELQIKGAIKAKMDEMVSCRAPWIFENEKLRASAFEFRLV